MALTAGRLIWPEAAEASPFDPVGAIATRSGLPQNEVARLIANCDANQQSMTFCAWRDELVADHALDDMATKVKARMPACADSLATQISAWREKRDRLCTRDAAAQDGGGSAATADRAQCAASMTADYARHLAPPGNCAVRPH